MEEVQIYAFFTEITKRKLLTKTNNFDKIVLDLNVLTI